MKKIRSNFKTLFPDYLFPNKQLCFEIQPIDFADFFLPKVLIYGVFFKLLAAAICSETLLGYRKSLLDQDLLLFPSEHFGNMESLKS